MRVLYKHHGFNYFGPGYSRGIAYAHNYLMHMQYPYQDILEIIWAP
jgi:hypothetical protein